MQRSCGMLQAPPLLVSWVDELMWGVNGRHGAPQDDEDDEDDDEEEEGNPHKTLKAAEVGPPALLLAVLLRGLWRMSRRRPWLGNPSCGVEHA